MLNAKRKLRWERAWVAVVVFAVICLPISSSAQAAGSGSESQSSPSATSDPGVTQAVPSALPAPSSGTGQNQEATQSQDASPTADSSNAEVNPSGTGLPVAKNLETGLPLRSVMSPLHWGHLSLLSVQAFEVYDSNYTSQQSIAARQFTAVQGLLVYSIQKAKTSLDLQYCPYVWFSQKQTYKDFTANALDLSTVHTFNRRWSLSASDNFQYSPNLANTLQSAFSADYVSQTSSQTAFLSAGRKALLNSANITVNTQLNESSRLSFNVLDEYVRLGSYTGSLNTTVPTITETMNSYGGGVNLTHQWNSRTSINLAYNYRKQMVVGLGGNSSYNTLSAGFSRVLKPGLNFSLEAGPGWSNTAAINGGQAHKQTTVQGSASLFKSFRNGGIALSFYRNSEFSGVISNSYNNRYDVSFTRRLFTRLNFMVSGSYVQQEYVGKPLSTGELGSAQISYMLSRNWSVFTGYRYLNLGGNQVWSGPQQLVSAGIRWAWQPETAHR